MNAKDFTNIIRTVIREEVRAAINEALHPGTLSETKSIKRVDPGITNKKIHTNTTFTKNTMLNDLLVETANTSEPLPNEAPIPDNAPAFLTDVLTRDYSELVSKFKK